MDKGCWTPVEKFGTEQGWQVGTVHADGSFDVRHHGETVGHVAWELMGEHNRMNALAVISAARHAGVDIQTACEALSAFKKCQTPYGNQRHGKRHHCLRRLRPPPDRHRNYHRGLRQRVGNARILAVLEPRSNTMKLGTMKAALPESLKDADQVFCYAGGVDWDVAEALAPLGGKLHVGKDFDAFVAEIVKNAEAGDHILVMSNGGFGGIHGKLLEALK